MFLPTERHAYDFTAIKIHDRRKIEPAFFRVNIIYVTAHFFGAKPFSRIMRAIRLQLMGRPYTFDLNSLRSALRRKTSCWQGTLQAHHGRPFGFSGRMRIFHDQASHSIRF